MKNPEQFQKDLNVIVADTDWQTFETLNGLSGQYNILNLSSDFAVSFMMQYEHIDVMFLSTKIANLDNLKKQALRKKVKVYIFGTDASYPADKAEILAILENEKCLKLQKIKPVTKDGPKKLFRNIFENKNPQKLQAVPGKEKSENPSGPIKKNSTEDPELSIKKNSIQNPDNFIKNKATKNSAKKQGSADAEKGQEHQSEEPDFFSSFNLSDDEFWQDKNINKDPNPSYGKGQKSKKSKILSGCEINNMKSPMNEKLRDFPHKYLNERYEPLNENGPYQLNCRTAPPKVIAIKQKVIVFLRAKGGVGSTILSVYLANKFSRLKTLLIDLNFSEGGSDVGYYLEIPKTPNMVMFTEGYNRNSLNNAVINIKDNFDVLQSPPSYELSRKMDLQDIYSLVDVARKKYHLIIFDLPNRIDDIYLGVLDLADLVVMVSDFSRGSIGRLTDINNRFIYSDLEKILILNRNSNGNGKYLTKNGLKNFFGIKDVISLNENTFLSGRSEFSNFDFDCLQDFKLFSEKVMERLTCD